MYAVIPVAAGSTRVVGKNLTLIGSTPLLQRAVLVAREAGLDPVILVEAHQSDEADTYAAVARLLRCRIVTRPDSVDRRDTTLDAVIAATVTEYPWLAEDDLVMLQATVVCQPDHIRSLVEAQPRKPTALATPNRHIIWNAQGAVTPRVNGQDSNTFREIGVRYYPKGWVGPPQQIHPIDDPIVDVDYPEDTHAAQPIKNVLFRVRGNPRVGTGHIRRCVAIAAEVQRHRIGFTGTADTDPDMVRRIVPEKWRHLRQEPHVIVNDTLDTHRGEVSKYGVPWIALEDEGEDAPLAEHTVNALYGTGLSGGRWADIRPEFYAVAGWNPQGGILVSFGGTDPAGLTEWACNHLPGVRVLAPPLREVADHSSLIRGGNVAEEINRARLVVTSGGRTVMEALFCRRPVLVVCQNPRELRHTHLRPEQGVLNMGLAGAGAERRLLDTLAEMTPQGLRGLYEATEGQVDGGGLRRIAGLIEGILR